MVHYYASKHGIKSEHDLVFPTKGGSWQSVRNWRRRGFHTACAEAGLVETVDQGGEKIEVPKFRPYDLRHFFASMLIERGENLKRIQKLMGHADIQTTLNVYGHIIERVEMDAEKAVGLLASISKPSCGNPVAQEGQ